MLSFALSVGVASLFGVDVLQDDRPIKAEASKKRMFLFITKEGLILAKVTRKKRKIPTPKTKKGEQSPLLTLFSA